MTKQLYFFTLLLFSTSILRAQEVKVDSITLTYRYLVHVPAKTPAEGKHPLLLFLHGSGERGKDINLVRTHDPVAIFQRHHKGEFPFLFIAPQCPEGQYWNTETLVHLLDELERKYPIDKDRIYISGLSMGGYGTWKLAQQIPDRIAAIAPICGWADAEDLCMLRHIPVWAFHGGKDETVLPQESEKAIAALKQLGAETRLTIYPEEGHVCWNTAYADAELYKWLLSQRRMGSPLPLNKKELDSYTGNYHYTHPQTGDTLLTNIRIKEGKLWYSVPRYNFEAAMYRVKKDLFRLEGVPMGKDSELFFERNTRGEIKGHRYFPCDETFVPKLEK